MARYPCIAVLVAALLFALSLEGEQAAAPAVELTITPSFAPDTFIPVREAVFLTMSRPITPEEGSLSILFGQNDVTSLFRYDEGKLVFDSTKMPLPSGEHEVVVFRVSRDGTWTELARFPMKVLSKRGFVKAELTPAADLTGKGQLDETHTPDDNAPTRSSFQDGTLQMTLRSEHVRSGFAIRSESQIVGVTFTQEALRFATEGERAPAIDLSSYRIDVQKGSTVLSVGHLGFGSLRHLVNGFSSRGVSLKLGEGKRYSLQLTALNGSSVVGWDNFLGLGDEQHRILGATFGYEVIGSRPGGLRLEGTLFRGSLQPFTGFNQGGIRTADRSEGAGLRVAASTADQRITVDAGYTASQFTEARDLEVEEGLVVTPIPSRRRGARYLDASFVLLRDRKLRENLPLNVSLNVHHERIEPLFRSVGTFVQADLQSNAADITMSLGAVALQLAHTRTHDNLAGLGNVLTTNTHRSAVTVGIPLTTMFSSMPSSRGFPTVSIQFDTTRQFGGNVPLRSGFTAADIPDLTSANASVGLDWTVGRFRAGYRIGRTRQNNDQPARERADFETGTHTVSLGFQPMERLGFGVDLSREESENVENARIDTAERFGTNLTWTLFGETALTGNVSRVRGRNNFRTTESDGVDGFLELASGFRLSRGSAERRRGRIFLRYADQRSRSSDAVFGIASDRQGATVTSGLTLSLF